MDKVFIEQGDSAYRKMFAKNGYQVVSDLRKATLVCFTGGSDVLPLLYGHEPLSYIHSYNVDRDVKCVSLFKQAQQRCLPMVGICRGGQFLNVMNGGTMIQDVHGHLEEHPLHIRLPNGTIYDVERASSTHHQMMRNAPGVIPIGICPVNIANRHTWWDIYEQRFIHTDTVENTEVVYYPETRSLCFQPHPEFPGYDKLAEVFFKTMEGTILAP